MIFDLHPKIAISNIIDWFFIVARNISADSSTPSKPTYNIHLYIYILHIQRILIFIRHFRRSSKKENNTKKNIVLVISRSIHSYTISLKYSKRWTLKENKYINNWKYLKYGTSLESILKFCSLKSREKWIKIYCECKASHTHTHTTDILTQTHFHTQNGIAHKR